MSRIKQRPTDNTHSPASVATLLLELVVVCFVGMIVGLLLATALGLPNSMATPHLYYCIVSVCSMGAPAVFVLRRQRQWLQAFASPKQRHVALALLLFVFSYPLAAFLTQWNVMIHLPEFLASYETSSRTAFEASQRQLQTLLIGGNGANLFLNLMVFAVVPAVSEELLFRGVLQRIFHQQFRQHHVAIWLAALVFSLIHVQMLAFFPRWWLGIVIGYAYYHTKTLWAPILLHLLNNATVVVMLHYWGNTSWYDQFTHTPISWRFGALAIISLLLVVLTIRFYSIRPKTNAFSIIDNHKTS